LESEIGNLILKRSKTSLEFIEKALTGTRPLMGGRVREGWYPGCSDGKCRYLTQLLKSPFLPILEEFPPPLPSTS